MMTRPTAVASRTSGQVLVLVALLIGGIALGTLGIVRLSQQAHEQVHVHHVAQHAADAAGVIAARDLNFKAITNRALLANEIAIGQLLGLNAWFMMSRETSQRIALYTSWIPYVNAVTQHLARMMQGLEPALRQGIEAGVILQQLILAGLEAAQWVFHQAAWITTISTIEEVIKGGSEDYELVLLNHQTLMDLQHVWFRFQNRTQGNRAAQEYVRLTSESRDGFTRERRYRWFSTFIVRAERAGGSEVRHRSDNRLVWQAVDTLSIHERLFLRWRENRLGAGSYYLLDRPPLRSRSYDYGQSYRRNAAASRTAAIRARRLQSSHRVPSYYQLNPSESGIPSITLVVRRPEQHELPMIWGAGRAEVVFSRPVDLWPRTDRRGERANLFNALWRAQPAIIPEVERQILGLQV
ncbi:MAG: hypothetical protein JJU10_04125 [Idiomarina sp.]|nr:hypothetical protein [Idiomarina sp.]